MTRRPHARPAAAPATAGTPLDAAVTRERQRALRALLQQPLLSASGPRADEFALVRRHAPWLREWLARNPGWRLHVDRELARLRKTPADLTDGTRPARDPVSERSFTRRGYVLLCLTLAALARADRQTTLGRLAEQVVALTADDPALAAAGVTFDLTSRDQRRDLVHVVRLLLELRVLARVHGDEQQFLAARGDALYNVDRAALAAVPNFARGPSTIELRRFEERLAAIVDEPVPDTDEGRNRRLRSRLTRLLLEEPVVYYDELTHEELAYLTSQRALLLRQIAEATGLVPEVRREGIAMTDDQGDATDLGLPEEGTEGHLTLLVAEQLAGIARHRAGVPVGPAALHQHTAALIARHRAHWRRDVGVPGAEVALAEQTIDRLEALRLVRRTPEGVLPRPAIGRFALVTSPNAGANP